MRIDVNLEKLLKEELRSLHSSMNIGVDDCELVLTQIVEPMSTYFSSDIFTPEIEYLLCRVYRLSVSLMFDEQEDQMIAKKIKSLTEKEKSSISSSFESCVEHKIGRNIIKSYLNKKDPSIYLFFSLFWKYESSKDQTAKNLVIEQIKKTCLDNQNAMFPIQISNDLRNKFMNISQANHSEYDQVLSKIKEIQCNVINTQYWTRFVLLLY